MPQSFRPRVVATVALVASAVVILPTGGYYYHLRQQVAALVEPSWRPDKNGTLILCGGGRMPDEVRDCFLDCAGGRDARLVIIPAHPTTHDDKARLTAFWKSSRVASVDVLDAATRDEANGNDFAATLASATGVWISGGDQAYLADLYVGTEVERQLQALIARGGVVCGTSAGAAAMTHVMIYGDSSIDRQGFDLMPGVVIDQHFFHRNRTQRLLEVLAKHPQLVGVGIDEHTALVVQKRGARWTVIGQSYAMVCLPGEEKFPRLEVLKSGDSTDIETLKANHGGVAIRSPKLMDETLGRDSGW